MVISGKGGDVGEDEDDCNVKVPGATDPDPDADVDTPLSVPDGERSGPDGISQVLRKGDVSSSTEKSRLSVDALRLTEFIISRSLEAEAKVEADGVFFLLAMTMCLFCSKTHAPAKKRHVPTASHMPSIQYPQLPPTWAMPLVLLRARATIPS